MNTQDYFDTFNDSEYSDFEQLATVNFDSIIAALHTQLAAMPPFNPPLPRFIDVRGDKEIIADLRQQLAAVTAERDALETALAEALDSANYWHSQSVSKGGE